MATQDLYTTGEESRLPASAAGSIIINSSYREIKSSLDKRAEKSRPSFSYRLLR